MSAVLTLLALPLLPAGQASAASYSVTMEGYAFSPASLSVPAGSTVTWTNEDTAPHDVKTTSGPASIHSPMLDKGESWSFTFATAGSYGYVCTVHPNMTAGITVRAAAPATTAAPTAHEHHTGSSSGHRATAPIRTTPGSGPPTTRRPSSSPSGTASTASPAAAGQSPQASPSSPAAQAAQQAQTQTTASAARPLDPLLVLTGIVAGVAVLCLLLVGSRASAPQVPQAPQPPRKDEV
ncbi:cupredoxin domain-containing protein [Streptomyces swartbergensis]|uniref:Copper-binding protein n=1 Tax=Streptomyces swartbergensis TaxID=487165 RepID=A0A243S287_9ACTN|nr:cupredoxin family copper-binding protein [Streptomyces swartbergensis]OUD01665.1 copper-binding protein [Streptomyces swartbergensis]